MSKKTVSESINKDINFSDVMRTSSEETSDRVVTLVRSDSLAEPSMS